MDVIPENTLRTLNSTSMFLLLYHMVDTSAGGQLVSPGRLSVCRYWHGLLDISVIEIYSS